MSGDRWAHFRQDLFFLECPSPKGVGLILFFKEQCNIDSLGLNNRLWIEQRPDRHVGKCQPGRIKPIVPPTLATLDTCGQLQTQGGAFP